jgi:Flp pilus assembly protein protease CpaA
MISEVFNLENSIVGAMLLIAVILDLKSKKVRNPITISMLAISLLAQVSLHGLSALPIAFASFATAFVICLPLYLMKIFGGGDFKLLLAVSPLLYWKSILVIVAASFVWGALLGLFRALLDGQGKVLFQNMLGIVTRSKTQATQLHMIPFTVALFFGFISFITLSQAGMGLL